MFRIQDASLNTQAEPQNIKNNGKIAKFGKLRTLKNSKLWWYVLAKCLKVFQKLFVCSKLCKFCLIFI